MPLMIEFRGLISHVLDDTPPVTAFLRNLPNNRHYPRLYVTPKDVIGTTTIPYIGTAGEFDVYDIDGLHLTVAPVIPGHNPDNNFQRHVLHLTEISDGTELSTGVRNRDYDTDDFASFLENPGGALSVKSYWKWRSDFSGGTIDRRCVAARPSLMLQTNGNPVISGETKGGKTYTMSLRNGARVLMRNEAKAEDRTDFLAHTKVLYRYQKFAQPYDSDEECSKTPHERPGPGPVIGVQCSNTQYP